MWITCCRRRNDKKSPTPWADSHRELHGFDPIFLPTEKAIVLEIHHISSSSEFLVNKNLRFKTAKHSKKIFLQDKEKIHGKADACRGFFVRYCRKRYGLERINPYVRPPLPVPAFFPGFVHKTIHRRFQPLVQGHPQSSNRYPQHREHRADLPAEIPPLIPVVPDTILPVYQ